MGTVVVLGSLITDLVARAPRLPYPGESLVSDDFSISLGGKGINQAIAAKRLGVEVTLIGRVGTDAFGDAFFPVLAEEHIDSTYVERDTAIGTGVSVVVVVEESGQNAIIAVPRANLAVPSETVQAALQAADAARGQSPAVFLTQCETSRVSYMVGLQRARELGFITILNAAPIPREPLSDELYTLVDVLIVNEVEAASLAQIPVKSVETAKEAADVLLARGPQHTIITLGGQGALWSKREQWHGPLSTSSHQLLPPFPVKAIDTTAAGDSFCGALAACLANGEPIEDALRRASAAGAIAVTRKGAIAALPTAEEIEDLLSQVQP